MTDTNQPSHPSLEDPDEFEGVGADFRNPRWSPVDLDGFDDVTGEPIPGWTPPERDQADDEEAERERIGNETHAQHEREAGRFPEHNPDFPDVDPATGDERETTEGEAR